MARLPSIADTAGRRLLPQADLRIEGGSPDAFGAAAGRGLQALGGAVQEVGGAIQQFELAKAREAEQTAEFDRQAQFVKFGSAEDERLTTAARDINGSAIDFTKTFMTSFDQRRDEFLAGVPTRHKSQWEAKFEALRGQVSGAALKTEFGQRDAWSKTTLTTSLGSLQNGAAQNPDGIAEYRAQGETLIDTSLLSAQDKEAARASWRGTIAVAAATGDVERDPLGALKRLGGTDPETIYDVKRGVPPTQRVTPSGALSGTIVDGLKKRGLTDVEARGVAAGVAAESANDPAAFNSDGGGEGALGIGQWRGSRQRALLKKAGANPNLDQQLDHLVSELRGGDKGGKAVLGHDDEQAVLFHYVHDFMRPSEAGARGDMKRGLAALGLKATPASLPVAAEVRSDTKAAEADRAAGLPAVDPRYADMPLSARMQLIESAQRQIEHQDQLQFAAEQKDHGDKLNILLNELNDGKAGHADIDAARKAGWLTDYDEINRAEGILDARDKANDDLNRFNTMMNTPGYAFNHFDTEQKQAVDAGVKALGGSPMAAFQVWQKTGILATKGAQALRGAILSVDPAQVAQAASIASNMIERDPNAFTGVDGGEDIEKNAMLYRHYVSDLGKSSEEAVQMVAQRNTPEAKAKINASIDDERKFKKQITKDSVQVDSALSDKLGGWFTIDPDFTAPEQRTAIRQDFAELAWDHYRDHGDYAAARSYAYSQVQKLYGAVDGRLMKYPPTRAYPPVNGSWDYLFEQAASDIKGVTGKAVKPSDVYLMPLPTATAEAFRAGRPVPYEVHYVEHVDGQPVYQVLHGKAFIGDVRASKQAGMSNEERFRRGEQDREALRRAATSQRFPIRRGRDY